MSSESVPRRPVPNDDSANREQLKQRNKLTNSRQGTPPEREDHDSHLRKSPQSSSPGNNDIKMNQARAYLQAGREQGSPSNSRSASHQFTESGSSARFRQSSHNSEKGTPDESGVDPLSLHILKRTGTSNVLQKRDAANPADEKIESSSTSRLASPDSFEYREDSSSASKDKKRPAQNSLLSRLIHPSHHLRIRLQEEEIDSEGLLRQEGNIADPYVVSSDRSRLSSESVVEPSRYIRVRSNTKEPGEFSKLVLAQQIDTSCSDSGSRGTDEEKRAAIWALRFSHDGRYVATGGQDTIVRVWAVIASPAQRAKFRNNENQPGAQYLLNTPMFESEPYRSYKGHSSDVLDLSWSKNGFLLSSSMDKTVRLWHVSREECLCCFQHSDFVTSISFHPRDDRYFLSGSLDCRLRLWSITEKAVKYWNELPDLVTAVVFTPDGRQAIAGTFSGMCLFYETDGLRYHTQIHVRSTRGKNSKGSKITGIQTISVSSNPSSDVKLLITSNDSRIRVYNLRDKALEAKFRGNENTCSQIHASFSHDGQYVISGSEDRQVFLWAIEPMSNDRRQKRRMDHFGAHENIVTAAVFAPPASISLLYKSQDPIYTVAVRARALKAGPLDDDPAYAIGLEASHDIIVCADDSGRMKIFRIDRAYEPRQRGRQGTDLSRRSMSTLWRNRADSSNSLSKNSISRTLSNQDSEISSSSESVPASRQSPEKQSPSIRTEAPTSTHNPDLTRRKASQVSRASVVSKDEEALKVIRETNDVNESFFYRGHLPLEAGEGSEAAVVEENQWNTDTDTSGSTFSSEDEHQPQAPPQMQHGTGVSDPEGGGMINCKRCDCNFFRAYRAHESFMKGTMKLICIRCGNVVM